MKMELILKPIVLFIYRHRAAVLAAIAGLVALGLLLAYCDFNLGYFGNALIWIISAPVWIAAISWIVKPRRTDP